MRDGVTQLTPTAHPLVKAEFYSARYGSTIFYNEGVGGDERIVKVQTDERVWGGQYDVWLDNSDEQLSNVDWRGRFLQLQFSFLGYPFPTPQYPFTVVYNQAKTSQEGKLLIHLTCLDYMSLLALQKPSFSSLYYNQEWQKSSNIDDYTLPSGDPIPTELKNELIANSDKTILQILMDILTLAGFLGEAGWFVPYSPAYYATVDPSLYLKPPISIPNYISGVRQLLELTKSWVRQRSSYLTLVCPSCEGVVYSYDTADLFFSNIESAGATIPNIIRVYCFNEAGDDWIHGEAIEEPGELDYTLLKPVIRNYILAPEMMVDARATEANLTTFAEGLLAKIKQERSQGRMVAPMNCSQELLDTIEVRDSRYTPTRVVTGVVHNIKRLYDRGRYEMEIQLNGETSGITPEGGNAAIPLYETDPPRAPTKAGGGWGQVININNCVPLEMVGIQMTKTVSDPGESTTLTPDLTVPTPPTVTKSTAAITLADPDVVLTHNEDILEGIDYTTEALSDPTVMAGLRVAYDSDSGAMDNGKWEAQTFKATSTDDITVVRLLLRRTSTLSIGTITASIRATSGGLPTGGDLASGTYTGNLINTAGYAEFIDIAMETPYTPTLNNTYAICVRHDGTNEYLYWRVISTGGYADGQRCRSTNGGVDWTGYSGADLIFQVLTTQAMDTPTLPISPYTPDVGDALYIGDSAPFDCVWYWVNQAGLGTYTIQHQYWDGYNWVAMPLDADGDTIANWKESGERHLTLATPGDWTSINIHGYTKYWIKHQLVSLTSMTRIPILGRVRVGNW